MNAPKAALLIIEDDKNIASMLGEYFINNGYHVANAQWGMDGVRRAQNHPTDLIILDIHLPDIDGFEAARLLRSAMRTRSIPIIFLTERANLEDRLRGLELHADDYITKPFAIQELALRVRNALERAHRGQNTNPVTGLPDGLLVDEHLAQCLQQQNILMTASLKNLDAFRSDFGFTAANQIVKAAALMIQDSLERLGRPGDFLGHISGADFIIVTGADCFPALKAHILSRIDRAFDYFCQDDSGGGYDNLHLIIQIKELLLQPNLFKNVQQLKAELERLCTQELF